MLDMEIWFTWAAGILLAIAALLVVIPTLPSGSSGRRWAIGAVAAIALAAISGILGIASRPEPPLDVSFSEPTPDASLEPGKNVKLVGNVSGLRKNHQLWIVSKPNENISYYYVVAGRPAASADGAWTLQDKTVGDDSDYGGGFYYFGVDADEACAKELRNLPSPRRLYTTPENPDPNHPDARKWPPSCKRQSQSTNIDFPEKKPAKK
jgi:hypothetical protein